jgi:hypothetical protein
LAPFSAADAAVAMFGKEALARPRRLHLKHQTLEGRDEVRDMLAHCLAGEAA